jgi:YHS domain-containing protein
MQSYDIYADLKQTNNILMELPLFRQLNDENDLLNERIHALKATIEYLESKNRRLSNKASKYKSLYKKSRGKCYIKSEKSEVIDLVSDDDEDEIPRNMCLGTIDILDIPVDGTPNEKKEIIEIVKAVEEEEAVEIEIEEIEVVEEEEIEVVDVEEEEVEIVDVEEEEEVEIVDVEEEEEVEIVDVEEEVVEVEEEVVEVEEEEVEEEEVEEEEVVEEEVVEEEVEEEEVVEEEVVEEEVVEEEVVEVEEEEAEEAEEQEVYDIEINGKTYYIQNEKNGPIYEADENGEISMEVGVYKNGKPTFF